MSYLEVQSVSDASLYDELISKCLDILKRLQEHEHGWVFSIPVDPVKLELDDYFDVIKEPMDLSTIRQNCYAKVYHSFDDFQSDVLLTFDNAMKNNKKTCLYQMAWELKKKFEDEVNVMLQQH
jgi:hypothetical protein